MSVTSTEQTTLFPQDQCIFCGKLRKYVKGSKSVEILAKCETAVAEQNIKECAAAKDDYTLLGQIAGIDLRAKQARYHET